MPRKRQTATNIWLILMAFVSLLLPAFPAVSGQSDPARIQSPEKCTTCHDIALDKRHQIGCTACHQGNPATDDQESAHQGLITSPASPDQAPEACGKCHRAETDMVKSNRHYTLHGHISKIRAAFGSTGGEKAIADLDTMDTPSDTTGLIDDLLRRRCLRCHVYYIGDDFAKTRHRVGCGACHLKPESAGSHMLLAKPDDEQCLSCHYGNHVGFDYYGRFEHDLNDEYQTPFLSVSQPPGPYGLNYHQLSSDLHQQAGLVCIDCHDKQQVMGEQTGQQDCSSCHDDRQFGQQNPDRITRTPDGFTYRSTATGRVYQLPVMRHPAHRIYRDTVTCQGCHARWSFSDSGTYLMRIDHEDFDDFYRLRLDGSSEVLKIISSQFDDNGDALEPSMTDKFNGTPKPGIWVKGFVERRWEPVRLIKDDAGRLSPARPILDVYVSWVDSEEQVRYDNLHTKTDNAGLLPYTPHTTGAAGLFYLERLRPYLEPATSAKQPIPAQNN